MARTKQVSDEEVVAAALRGSLERGPALTLVEIGAEVGLSAATVVQRFGSKRELMRRAIELRRQCVRAVDFRGDGDAVSRIIEGLSGLSGWMKTPEHVANATAVLHTDVADREFRELIDAGFRDHRIMIAATLDAGVASGQLKPCDTAVVARLLQLTLLGAWQSWAIEPRGELEEWVAQCLGSCIGPLLMTSQEDLTTLT